MRTVKLVRPFLLLLLSIAVLSGCKKDEISTTGSVKITYANRPSDLTVLISPAENPQLAITDWLTPDSYGTLTYELNIGNYILISSSSTFFPNVGFQIKAGQTTEIKFGADNGGHVQ